MREETSLSLVRCSGCGGDSFTADPDGLPVCDYCGTALGRPDPRCPRCGAGSDPGNRRCPSCGAVLTRECPICGSLNPLTADLCVVCGQTLDATDALFARLTTRTSDQFRHVRETGVRIKAKEELAWRARSSRMWADEERRRAEQVSAHAKRRRQERLIIALVMALIAIAIAVAIIFAVTATGPAPVPIFRS